MIKFLVMDVDGTLTDGKVYMGEDGEVMKTFDIKDGCGIKILLPQEGIIPVVITARNSKILEQRCKELHIEEIHQGITNKFDCLEKIIDQHSSSELKLNLSNVAYIGDDILDLQCLIPIKEAGGLSGCPINAAHEVIENCNYIAAHKGGEGAVRDFIEHIISCNHSNNEEDLNEQRFLLAAEFLLNLKNEDLTLGRHNVNDHFFYTVQEYVPSGTAEKPYECHRKYVDIQILVSGEELMQIIDINRTHECSTYDQDKDYTLYYSKDLATNVILRPRSVLILYPKDAHRSMPLKAAHTKIKKIVRKVLIK